jgi:Icc-related predicted phosphoesterase
MKIAMISDTHGRHRNYEPIEDCDLLIHAGDFSNSGKVQDVLDFIKWISVQKAERIVVIPGNHDMKPDRWRHLFSGTRIDFLESSGVQIDGAKIWGSPWTPWFYDWEYNFPENDDGTHARWEWSKIPADTNILITHGPPRGVFDRASDGNLCGCPALLERVLALRDLKLHVFGHIHEGYGMSYNTDPISVNASMIQVRDSNHLFSGPFNQPIVLDLEF